MPCRMYKIAERSQLNILKHVFNKDFNRFQTCYLQNNPQFLLKVCSGFHQVLFTARSVDDINKYGQAAWPVLAHRDY